VSLFRDKIFDTVLLLQRHTVCYCT